MNRDFEELFEFLTARKVKFLVVGGHAVAFHGKPRFTKDIDVFVESTPENARRLIRALDDFGFGSLNISLDDFVPPGKVLQLGHPPTRIDFLTEIDGVSFEEAWEGQIEGRFGSQTVAFIGLEQLIRNKSASGRPVDLVDLSLLQVSDKET